jgi:hypothetical protein
MFVLRVGFRSRWTTAFSSRLLLGDGPSNEPVAIAPEPRERQTVNRQAHGCEEVARMQCSHSLLLSAGLALVPILFNEIPVTELAVVHLFSK